MVICRSMGRAACSQLSLTGELFQNDGHAGASARYVAVMLYALNKGRE